jgi:hypothetical protein
MEQKNLFWMIEKTPDGYHRGVLVTRRGDKIWTGQPWADHADAYSEAAEELRRRIGAKER